METDLGNWEKPDVYERLGCTLQISGIDFDPDAFLNEWNLIEDKILFKGAIGLPEQFRDKLKVVDLTGDFLDSLYIFNMSNLLIIVSEATNLASQIQEATLFLQTHFNDLKKITSYVGIDDVILKFLAERDETLSNFQDFPPDFTNLVSKTGIQGIMLGGL